MVNKKIIAILLLDFILQAKNFLHLYKLYTKGVFMKE